MAQTLGTLRVAATTMAAWPARGVFAECPEDEGVALADLDLAAPHADRRDGAATTHADRRRRSDLHARRTGLATEPAHAR